MLATLKQRGQIKGLSSVRRRDFLKIGCAAGVAVAASPLAAPYVSNAQAAAGTTLKVQTFWSAGGVGHQIFETWCNSIIERSSGELARIIHAGRPI